MGRVRQQIWQQDCHIDMHHLFDVSFLVLRILILHRRDLLLFLLLVSNTVSCQPVSRADVNIDNDNKNVINLVWGIIMHRMHLWLEKCKNELLSSLFLYRELLPVTSFQHRHQKINYSGPALGITCCLQPLHEKIIM